MAKQGWSWGAFLFNASFLIGVKRYKMLWWYLLALIPFVNFIFLLAYSIYLGVKGHEIGANGAQFANQSEYDGFMKGVDHAGKIMFFVSLAIGVVVGIIFIALIASGVSFMHGNMQGMQMQNMQYGNTPAGM